MKKLSFILAAIFLLSTVMVLSGCLSTGPGNTTVFSGDGNVSISVPSGWNTNDPTILPAALIGVSNVANHEYVIVSGQPRSDLGTGSTLDDYLAQIKKSSVTVVPDGVWGDASSVTINGFSGLTARLTGTWISDKIDTTFVFDVLANNNYYYVIAGFTDTSLLNAHEATLQNIINSFTAPATSVIGGWKPYTPPGSIILFIVLLVLGIGLGFLGRSFKNRVGVPHPGGVLKVIMVVIWVLLILLFLAVDIKLGATKSGTGPIFPITVACAVITFFYLVYVYRREGFLTAVGNGIAGAAAGPMIFEFPFDLIVIPQIKASTTFLIAYFVPLDFAVLLTLSLLLLSRRVYITRYSMYALGAMFIVFAVWALFGFSYPSTPVSFTLNSISKVLSFLTVVALFSTGSKQTTQDEIKKPPE